MINTAAIKNMGINRIHKKSGVTVSDIVNQTLFYEKAATAAVKDIAPQFKGATDTETMRNIWQFLRYHVPYKADGFKKQVIRLPYDLVRNGGDCKSYSLFTAAVLNNLGIPAKYKLTTYDPAKPNAAHIYIVANDGIIIDAVFDKFNDEKKPFTAKYYNTMTQLAAVGNNGTLNGIVDQLSNTFQKLITEVFKKGLGAFAANDKMVNNLRALATGAKPYRIFAGQAMPFFRGVRFLILLAFRSNLKGISTLFAKAMKNNDRQPYYRLFYALGGNYQTSLWPVINAAKDLKPLNKDVKQWAAEQLRAAQNQKDFDQFKGFLGDAWKYSKVGVVTETAGVGGALATISGMVTAILAWATANPDLANKALETIGGRNNNNNDQPPIPPDNEEGGGTDVATKLGIAALAAKFLGVF